MLRAFHTTNTISHYGLISVQLLQNEELFWLNAHQVVPIDSRVQAGPRSNPYHSSSPASLPLIVCLSWETPDILSETEQVLLLLMEDPEPSLRVQQGSTCEKQDEKKIMFTCASSEACNAFQQPIAHRLHC